MKKAAILMLFVAVGFLAGCETLKGIGKDIENTGHNIQEIVTGKPNQN